VLPPDLQTFPQVFANAGYRTCSLAKWHTPKHPTWQEMDPFQLQPDIAGCFDFADPSLEPEHNVVKRLSERTLIMAGTYPDVPDRPHPSAHLTNLAVDWLEAAAREDQPFLLRVSHLWPHTPVLAPRPWDTLYAPGDVPCRAGNREMYANRSLYDRWTADMHRGLDIPEETWRRICACYYGLCACVDHEVGRLLAALDRLGLTENTIVAFNADHGKNLGEYGACEKDTFDREVWRVPSLLSWPGHMPQNDHRTDLCELIDFGPTLLALAGVERPAGFEGRDLLASDEPDAVYGVIGWGDDPSYPADEIDVDECGDARRAAIRTRRWRYDCTVRFDGHAAAPDERDGTLFDIENDPYEERNLINDPALAETVSDLHTRLERWLAKT